MDKKITFLILHYCTIEDTITCVKSIKERIDNENYDIVIVDNGSMNNSKEQLDELFSNDEKVHILYSEKNLGFARGNNIGFKYSKEVLKSDFIVMMNSDTYLIQDDFYDIINKEYLKSKFAILGPKILLPNNRICNYPEKLITKKELITNIIKSYIKLFMLYTRTIYLYEKIKNKKKGKKINVERNNEVVNKRRENIVIHGSCIIFSPEYINKFDGIDDRTFLYKEEQLLYIRIIKNDLISIYNPELLIFHNESSSTKKTCKNNIKRFILFYKNQIKSSKIVLKEMKEL